MNNREIIQPFLEGLVPEIAKSQAEKGLTASGTSVRLLEVLMVNDNLGQLIDGSGSFYFQMHGRGPTGSATKGDKTLQEIIYDWLEFKKYGLTWDTDKERTSLSYAISHKIHAKGYSHDAPYTYKKNADSKVLTDVITQSRVDALANVFAEEQMILISSDILTLK